MLTDAQARRLKIRQELQQWADSDEGQRAFAEASESVHRAVASLRESTRIDAQMLQQPVTL